MNNLQGKNKRRQFIFNDTIHNVKLSCDSQEEIDFLNYCVESCNLGIFNDFEYQPQSFILSDAVKFKDTNNKEKTLFREHIYTPDFKILFNGIKYKNLSTEFKIPLTNLSSINEIFIDVKGVFSRNDGGRSFSINQKWLYQRFKVYVYKLVPKKFFAKFGVPDSCVLTQKTKKPRTMFKGFQTIKETFKSLLK